MHHHILQRVTHYWYRNSYVCVSRTLMCVNSVCDFIRRHRFFPTLLDFYCSGIWFPSSLPLLGLMGNYKTKLVKQNVHVTGAFKRRVNILSLTLLMLQPVAILIVEVTTLKLLLTVVGHWHWDERVHGVKPPLNRKSNTLYLGELNSKFR